MTRLTRQIISIALLLPVMGASRVHADLAEEYSVKMAFIYNFAKFVQWPATSFPEADSPIVLCIFGDNPFGTACDSIGGRLVGGRKFTIRQVNRLEGCEGCHILYLCSTERESAVQILKALACSSVLTISDMAEFVRLGGTIGFITVGNKIRFQINLAAAQACGLEISSKLLGLAESVCENRN